MEKKILLTQIPVYIPARVVEGKSRWHIVYSYTNGYTGEVIRVKPTYNLNRIKSIRERRKNAQRIAQEINSLLPLGWPWKQIEQAKTELSHTSFIEAIDFAFKIKCVNLRPRSVGSYESRLKPLKEWVFKKKKNLTIGGFDKRWAQRFSDYLLIERKWRGKPMGPGTYNSYIIFLKGLWKILKKREYVTVDVWEDFSELKVTEKVARDFSEKELSHIIKRVAATDRFLLLAVVLLYYCFVRPTELTRLRCRHVKVKEGRIILPGEVTKNSNNRMPTIPENVSEFIASFNLSAHPSNAYVFGKRAQKSKTICITEAFPCNYKIFNNRIQAILRDLNKEGLIGSTEGLTFYSLKDTGGQDLIDQGVDAWQIMKQMGHAKLETTQIYLERRRKVNPAIQKHKTNILDGIDF